VQQFLRLKPAGRDVRNRGETQPGHGPDSFQPQRRFLVTQVGDVDPGAGGDPVRSLGKLARILAGHFEREVLEQDGSGGGRHGRHRRTIELAGSVVKT
jgi:hypothetical protein